MRLLAGLATGLFVVGLVGNAYAYRIDMYSHEGLSGSSWAEVTGDGSNKVEFDLGLGTDTIADIRGFFFDLVSF